MAMNAAYIAALAAYGETIVTHIGLVDAGGTEISGGGYARQPASWAVPSSGVNAPAADLVFSVPAAAVVAGWRGFSALTGGTNYGGASLTEVTFGNAGTYTLAAASTGIEHAAA